MLICSRRLLPSFSHDFLRLLSCSLTHTPAYPLFLQPSCVRTFSVHTSLCSHLFRLVGLMTKGVVSASGIIIFLVFFFFFFFLMFSFCKGCVSAVRLMSTCPSCIVRTAGWSLRRCPRRLAGLMPVSLYVDDCGFSECSGFEMTCAGRVSIMSSACECSGMFVAVQVVCQAAHADQVGKLH